MSCTKIIDVDLNSADPQVIIEGEVTDQVGGIQVKITKTVNFSDPNVFPALRSAVVTLSDDTGTNTTLTETNPGIYTLDSVVGVPGRTYTLQIVAEGRTYTATSKMPSTLNLQGIIIEESAFGGGPGGGTDSTQSYTVQPIFEDAAGESNYYRLIQSANGNVDNSFFNVTNDDFFNGQEFPFPVFNDGLNLRSGDTVHVAMHNIDKPTYDYFFSLGQVISGQSGTPANPVTNIKGGALGYFSAFTVGVTSGVVP